jgi:large subunit ribosomal protein L30
MGSFIVLRIRGRVDVRYDISETLNRLNLPRKFHATIIPDDEVYKGMLYKVKDYIAYGPADPETVKELLLKRGRLKGNKAITEEMIKDLTGMDLDELAKELSAGSLKLKDIKGLKPVFRLNPPRGGFKGSIKKHIKVGGELGYREDISALIKRML